MIQRCPKCGHWCDGEKLSAGDRYERGYNKAGEIGDNIGKIGNILGKTVGKYTRKIAKFGGEIVGGQMLGIGDAILGDSYRFQCQSCGNEWSCDSEEEDQKERFIQEMTNKLSEIIQQLDEYSAEEDDDQQVIRSIIESLDKLCSNESDSSILALLYQIRSYAYYILFDYVTAISEIERAIQFKDTPENRAIRGLYKLNENPFPEFGKDFVEGVKDLTSIYEKDYDEPAVFTKSRLSQALSNAIDVYIDFFQNIPAAERRFICFTERIQAMGNNILVLPLGNIPEGITLAGGLPRKNVIYEVHPFKPNHYVSLDNFEFDMFNDKISEFKWIMENLGARKISVNIISDSSEKDSKNTKQDIKAGGGYKAVEAKGGYSSDSSKEKYNSLYLSFEEHGEFSIGYDHPHIPEKLIWYPHSEQWKQKVESRLAGRVNSFSIRFESKSNYSLSEAEAKELEAEMNFISAHVNGSYATESDYHISRSVAHIWQVNVEFYPLSSYQTKDTSSEETIVSQNLLTAAEKEYLDTYRNVIKDGKITDHERKLLDKISSQAGLSAERVAELEASIQAPKKKPWWKNLFK